MENITAQTSSEVSPISVQLPAQLASVRTLDIGCGPHKLKGAVGIDLRPLVGVDMVVDLDKHPWALPADHYEFIRCQHVIEHLADLFGLAREVHRLGRNGCIVEFKTPHYSSYASWGDPTHRWHFALGSIPQLFDMALGQGKFRVKKIEAKFTGSGLDLFGWIIYRFSRKKYEKHFAWIFPANEIICEIEIIK